MYKPAKLSKIAVSISAALALAAMGNAQGQSLEEIVVTARKKEESLQDAPSPFPHSVSWNLRLRDL
ncbi:MAG: hypothetical protein AB8B96_13750 [Lysobacterales bacterium]